MMTRLIGLLICFSNFFSLFLFAQDCSIFPIMDVENHVSMPKNFRTSESAYNLNLSSASQTPSRKGLDELKISGSGQFSEKGFINLIHKIPQPFIVVDLRQETHGFINGHAVSWVASTNWVNKGKQLNEIDRDESQKLNFENHSEYIRLKFANQFMNIHVKKSITEKEFVRGKGQGYVRIPVTDNHGPTDEEVDQFLEFYKGLPANTWLHFHCRAGRGRTTTFMIMVDILRNAHQVSLQDILLRQLLIGGKDMGKKQDPTNPEHVHSIARFKFIQQFYQYIQQHPDLRISFSKWKALPVKGEYSTGM